MLHLKLSHLTVFMASAVLSGLLPTPLAAGEPYDMMKCLEEGRYCYDGDDDDIFDAILGIDPKKICSCHDTPPPRDGSASPFVGIRWHLVPGTFDLVVVSPVLFDEVRIKTPVGLEGGLKYLERSEQWVAASCEGDSLALEGPPSSYAHWRFQTEADSQPVPLEVEVRSSLGTQTVRSDPTHSSEGSVDTVEDSLSTDSKPIDQPKPDWDLGTLSTGRIYNTTVTAKNISCSGKHGFSIRVEGENWLRITGPQELEKIKRGSSKTTDSVVDLRDQPPGEYRNRLLIDCLTCPPSCSQDLQVINVKVIVIP